MGSRTVKRIADVSKLRTYQFPQASNSHPYYLLSCVYSLDNIFYSHFLKFS